MIAVLLADVVGYSRLMSADEEATHAMLTECFGSLIEPKISDHGGRLIRTSGDGLLVEFDSAFDAVRCGLEIQQVLSARNAGVNIEHRFQMRIGVNAGDIIVDKRDIYGNSVNIAARLETLAEPGELFVTNSVRDQLLGHPDLVFEDRGLHRLKNIDPPTRVFRVQRAQEQKRLSLLPRMWLAVRRFAQLLASPRPASLFGVLAVVLAVAAYLGALPFWNGRNPQSAQASIMVLPFRSMSDNQEEGYFADAVTDELTTHLSRMADTLVIARGTAFTYKGKIVDPRRIGREVDVRYLLEGSIRKVGTRVQANAQLVDARSAVYIWADHFESDVTDLFELQEEVTGRIASSLGVQLVKAENRRASRERASDAQSIDLRLRAMALLIDSMTPQNTLAARRYFEESARLNPLSANSWSQLANVLIYDYLNRWNEAVDAGGRDSLLTQSEAALKKAFALDPTIALSHLADGFIRRAKGDHQGALNAYDRAITLDPNLALAYAQKANQLVLTGRAQEALPLVLRAVRIDPGPLHQAVYKWITGRTLVAMRRYDEAIPWLQKSVEQRGTLWFTRAYLVSSLAHAGRPVEATEALKDFERALPGYDLARIQEIYRKEIPNDNPEFQKTLQELYEGLRLAGMK
jgi:adenylate cyclase